MPSDQGSALRSHTSSAFSAQKAQPWAQRRWPSAAESWLFGTGLVPLWSGTSLPGPGPAVLPGGLGGWHAASWWHYTGPSKPSPLLHSSDLLLGGLPLVDGDPAHWTQRRKKPSLRKLRHSYLWSSSPGSQGVSSRPTTQQQRRTRYRLAVGPLLLRKADGPVLGQVSPCIL